MNAAVSKAARDAERNTQRRIEGGFYVFGALFILLSGRVIYLQTVPSMLGQSDKSFRKHEVLPARRGAILATDGSALAVTMDEYTVAANPRVWTQAEKERISDILVKTIGGKKQEYLAQLARVNRPDGSKNYYVKLARHVSQDRIELLKKLMGPQKDEKRQQRTARKKFYAPLILEPSPRRHYPLNNVAPQLIGFTDNAGKGVDGMERAYQNQVGGQNGYRDTLVDPQGRAVPGTVNSWKEPVDGNTIVTTIDPKIQAAADATMNAVYQKFKPNFCVTVVMRPSTGEIVAVSTAPGFDLNKRPKNMVELATNRAFSYAYEPGSTWKILTACAAVENVPDWSSKQFLVTGALPVGKHVMHDWQFWSGKSKTEYKTLATGIRDSSNITMYKFAQLMPRNTLLDYAKKFGIGEKPELPGFNVHPGYLPRTEPKDWSEAQYANFSFGQGMMITPLQLASMGSVVANGGLLMKPMLVKEVKDPRGKTIKLFRPEVKRRVVARSTALEVTKMMRKVVAEGTARRYIFIPGYASVGKTGSAQKAEGKYGYRAGKFISSFVGFLPQERPEYVIAVMADEPHGSHWGSEVCGPAFTAVAQEAMVQMRLVMGTQAPPPNPALMERPGPAPQT